MYMNILEYITNTNNNNKIIHFKLLQLKNYINN